MTISFNHIDRAVEITRKMLRGRTALQSIMRDKYQQTVKGPIDAFEETMQRTGKSVIEVFFDAAEGQFNEFRILVLLSAAVEIIEKEARR